MNPNSSDASVPVVDRETVIGAPDRRSEGPRWVVSLFLASLALWVGAAVYLSAGVLPVLFTSLEPADAGRIAALVFPIYFRAGLVVGIVATASAALLARREGGRWRAVFALLVCMTLAQGWSAVVLHPEMARIRGVAEQVERFQYLHALSVRLNGIVLAGGMLLLAAGGFLLAPRRGRA
jgi:hypothetical protein